jgi:nicotinamide-nucleotide amidase
MSDYYDEFEAVKLLTSLGETLAVAESCTGGGLGAAIVNVSGCSKVFLGGVICYSNEVKEKIVGVPLELLKNHGAVSEAVACAMAEGVAKLIGADIGIGVTGIAGPGGAVPGKPAGTVHFAISRNEQTFHTKLQISASRAEVQKTTISAVLEQLCKMLENVTKMKTEE